MEIKHNRMLTRRAQDLRKNETPQERRLWYAFLCQYPIRMRRQVTVHHFILDFYCAKAKVAIELDGSQHYEEQGMQYDKERDAILEGYGIKVLRFGNNEVNDNFAGVCAEIERVVKERVGEQ